MYGVGQPVFGCQVGKVGKLVESSGEPGLEEFPGQALGLGGKPVEEGADNGQNCQSKTGRRSAIAGALNNCR